MKKVSPLILFLILLSSIAFAGSSDIVQKWLDFKVSARSGGTSKGVAVDMGDGTFVVLNGSVPSACADSCPSADGVTAPQSMELLSAGIKLWATGTYSACSNTCGDGSHARTVSCVTPSGQAATGCDEATKPSASNACNDMSGCSRSWFIGTFGACAPACGASVQTRSVACLRSDGVTIDDALCSGEKPALTQGCSDSSRCSYLWSSGEFGECAAGCSETSSRLRTVTCLRHDQTGVNADAPVADASCSGAGAKPDASESCPSFATCVAPDVTIAGPAIASVGAAAVFTPTLSGNVATCAWTFGDGTGQSSCGPVSHVFAARGNYAVELLATGVNSLQTKTATHAISVASPAVAEFVAPTAQASIATSFVSTSSGDVASCSWDFGDGTSATAGCSVNHTFVTVGTYAVTLTATGQDGTASTRQRNVSAGYPVLASCQALLTALPGTPSGAYTINPGSGNVSAYCDMTTDGGGWTRLNPTIATATRTLSAAGVITGPNNHDNSACNSTAFNYKVTGITVPFTRIRLDLTRGSTILQCSKVSTITNINTTLNSDTGFVSGGVFTSRAMCAWGDNIWAYTTPNVSTSGLPSYTWRVYANADTTTPNGFTYKTTCNTAADTGTYTTTLYVR